MLQNLFTNSKTPAPVVAPEPPAMPTLMELTINYYGSVIRVAAVPESSITRYRIYCPMNGGGEEVRITEEDAGKGRAAGLGILLRNETEILSKVSVFINNRPFTEGEPRREALKAWIDTAVAGAKDKIERSTKLSTVEILAEMGFTDKSE